MKGFLADVFAPLALHGWDGLGKYLPTATTPPPKQAHITHHSK